MGKERRTHNYIRNFVVRSFIINVSDLINFVLNEKLALHTSRNIENMKVHMITYIYSLL